MALTKADLDERASEVETRMHTLVQTLKRRARDRPWNGRERISGIHRIVVPSLAESGVRISIIFTFDAGAHASGWWRNSDYDQCYHLSFVAMSGPEYVQMPELDKRVWPRVFFGLDAVKMTWWEPPASEHDPYRNAPSSRYTHHVRLFTDRATGKPIIPEAEVYTLKPWPEGDSPEKVFRS